MPVLAGAVSLRIATLAHPVSRGMVLHLSSSRAITYKAASVPRRGSRISLFKHSRLSECSPMIRQTLLATLDVFIG